MAPSLHAYQSIKQAKCTTCVPFSFPNRILRHGRAVLCNCSSKPHALKQAIISVGKSKFERRGIHASRMATNRKRTVQVKAMVNVEFASPSLILGIGLIGCGVVLLQMRTWQIKTSKDADIVIAAMISIVGSTLIFQGWRLDPLLLLCQVLTITVALFYGVETFTLRSQFRQNEEGAANDALSATVESQEETRMQQYQPQDQQWPGRSDTVVSGYLPEARPQPQYPWYAQDARSSDMQASQLELPGSRGAPVEEYISYNQRWSQPAYDYGRQPAAELDSASAGSWGYSSQPGAYLDGAQGYGGQPGTYSDRAQGYGDQPGAYSDRAQGYDGQPGTYSDRSAGYSGQPGAYSGRAEGYSGQPGAYSDRVESYTDQSAAYSDRGQQYNPSPANWQYGQETAQSLGTDAGQGSYRQVRGAVDQYIEQQQYMGYQGPDGNVGNGRQGAPAQPSSSKAQRSNSPNPIDDVEDF